MKLSEQRLQWPHMMKNEDFKKLVTGKSLSKQQGQQLQEQPLRVGGGLTSSLSRYVNLNLKIIILAKK